MKLSVSIPDDDVAFIDRYADAHGVNTRSGVVQRALSVLRVVELGDDYAAAWEEWDAGGDGELRERVAGDGLGAPGST